MVTIAVVDDEIEQVNTIKEKTQLWAKQNNQDVIVMPFTDPSEFWNSYDPTKYDAVFLDIDMKPMNGMQIAQKIRMVDLKTVIVFITNLSRFALKGYEVQAFDFIVKPIVENVFFYKLNKIIPYCLSKQEKLLEVHTAEGNVYLSESEIYYVEAVSHCIVFHTARGVFQEWNTLKSVKDRVSAVSFSECNRCYLVNMQHITALKQNSVIVHGDELLISRGKKKSFCSEIALYFGKAGN